MFLLRDSISEIDMVQVLHISKKYKKKQILQDISFQVQPHEMVAVIGRNGSGKSTLLQILSGMSKPDAGSIRYFDREICRKNYRSSCRVFAQYCGYVPQANGLMEELSVQDNISLWTGRSGKPSGMLCEMFALDELLGIPVMHLSGGMKRRVAIACAMANFPPVLLLDEPTAALDREYRRSIHNFFQEYLDMNGIIIAATHDDREIAMADKKLYIDKEGIAISDSGKSEGIAVCDSGKE